MITKGSRVRFTGFVNRDSYDKHPFFKEGEIYIVDEVIFSSDTTISLLKIENDPESINFSSDMFREVIKTSKLDFNEQEQWMLKNIPKVTYSYLTDTYIKNKKSKVIKLEY